MARTKQTARKAVAQMIPRSQLQMQAIAKRARKSANNQSDSEPQDANTQQFSLKFDDQIKCQENFVTGQILKCKNCQAILTNQCKIYEKKEYEQKREHKDAQKQKFLLKYDKVWICEFCSYHNNIDKKFNPPSLQNPCYLLQKAKKEKRNDMQMDIEASDDKVLIFCIDISGSMNMNVGVNGNSRLRCVKEAISGQISRMKVQKEKWKVGLVTFGSEVRLIGNFNAQLSVQKYHNFDDMVQEVSKLKDFGQPIDKCFKKLKKTVQELSTSGLTALGPGLLSSIELASKGTLGSKVIICTDGVANVGLSSPEFYTKVADYAKKKKVSVNVVALKGDNCNLKQLGKVSLSTGGAILKIDPNTLGTEFSKISKEEILGSESFITVKLNKIFNFCNVPADKLSKDKTTMKEDYGNFSSDTELTFEFEVIDYAQACKDPTIDETMFKRDKVPMQVQLTYTGRDGSRFLQVITDWRQLTSDQKAMYEGANFPLFAAGVLQSASKKIKDQQFDEADKIIKGFWSSIQKKFKKTEKKEQIEKFSQKVKKLEQVLGSKRAKIGNRGNSNGKSAVKSVKSKFSKAVVMDSDSEQQCLVNLMRARSRSNSEQSKSKSVPKGKIVPKDKSISKEKSVTKTQKKPTILKSKIAKSNRSVSKEKSVTKTQKKVALPKSKVVKQKRSVSKEKSVTKTQMKVTLLKTKIVKKTRNVSITPSKSQQASQSRSRSRNKK